MNGEGSGERNCEKTGSRKQELRGFRRQGSGFRNGNCLEAGSRKQVEAHHPGSFPLDQRPTR
jgi:hypothetical protein